MWHRDFTRGLSCALLFAFGTQSAIAATRVHTLNVNLAPKIEASAGQRERFAVDVPHVAGFDTGEWQRSGGTSVWRYTVRVPGAVSMSFHANEFALPVGATLEVTGTGGMPQAYRPGDGARGELWSRLVRGDTLNFTLRVPSSLESRVRFGLKSLQAGYRGLGGGVPDHPHFSKLQGAVTTAAACSENFACHATAQNSRNADATAAIVVGGVALCTGTLINNTRSDGTPYLLTARHCQDQPSSGVVAYWDAVTPCGTPLGVVYDTDNLAWLHTVDTVFEQQDVWLLKLNRPLSGDRVYFAGWDATGGAFVGGYSPHHALGRSRQYTEWFGQAIQQTLPAATLGVGFDSTYWGVVNAVGNVGSGASGGGLFNAEHRLVGIGSLANINAADGEGVCPLASPPAPTSSSIAALYSSLAAVWTSNADTTSSTNPVTLKSLLDPDNSGVLVLDGFEMLTRVRIDAAQGFVSTGSLVTLNWDGGAATSCSASGGTPGDGWTGMLPVSGSREVTRYQPGDAEYTVSCTDGTRSASASARVSWYDVSPQVHLSAADSSGFLGGTVRLSWNSNVVPCVASGGVAGDGWAGNKSPRGEQMVDLVQAGTATYSLTCGSGMRQASSSTQVTAQAPVAELTAVSNNMRVGSEVIIMQSAAGNSCTRTGGVPGSGWTTETNSSPFRVTSATAGTFRFTLTCDGGANDAIAHLDVVFTNDPPAATLTPSRTQAITVPAGPILDITADSPYAIDFTWVSNVAPCQLSFDGPGAHDGNVNPAMDLPGAGARTSVQDVVGTYEYRIICTRGPDTATATAIVEYVVAPPAVELTLLTPELAAHEPFMLAWNSTATPCVASGGAGGDGWTGPRADNSSQLITLTTAGTWVYTLTCGSGAGQVSDSVSITLGAPAVSFEPHAAEVMQGTGIALSWNSTVGPCTQIGDWASTTSFTAHGGNVALFNGTGVRNYGIRCGVTDIVEATTQVTYLPRPTVEITASAAAVDVGQPVTLTWTSANAGSCAVEGTGSADWSGELPASGSRTITRTAPGSHGFYINCGGEVDAVVVEWRSVLAGPPRPAGPTVTLNIDHTSRVAGQPVSISWTSTRAAVCRGAQGVSGDNWAGTLPVSGTRSIIVDGPGTFTWEISCEGAPPSVNASVSATYTAAPSGSSSGGGSSSSSSGGGGGGGGRIDLLLLVMLGLTALPVTRRWQRHFAR